MRKCPLRRGFLFVFLLSSLVFPAALPAQQSSFFPSSSYQLAMEALQAGKLNEALDHMQQAVLDSPQNLEMQYILAGFYLRVSRSEEAETIYRTLVRQDEEQFRKAYFELAGIASRRGDDREAFELLERARPVDPGRADLELGLIYMRKKDYGKAAEQFRQAGREKAEIAADAKTQEAIALLYLKRFDESKKLLESVKAMGIPPERAVELNKLLAMIEATERAEKPWHFSAIMGLEYDTNVLQNPLSTVLPAVPGVPSHEEDVAQLASLTMRYDYYRSEPWRLGISYNHYHLIYFKNDELTLTGARPSLYAFWENGPTIAGLEYMFSRYWVGTEPRADVNSLFPVLAYTYGDRWKTEIRADAEWREYHNETPDDQLLGLSVTEFYLMRKGLAHLRGGFLVQDDHMTQRDFGDFVTYQFMAGIQWPVWKDQWFLDLSGYVIQRNFEFDPLISNTRDRTDNEQDLNIMLRGPVADNLQLILLFQRIWNDSNITVTQTNGSFDPFNYRRAVFTCMLSYDY